MPGSATCLPLCCWPASQQPQRSTGSRRAPASTSHTGSQAAANQVSHRLSTGHPVMENLVCLAAFAVIAGAALWRQLRRMQMTWAEALLAPKGAELRWERTARGA